MTEHLDVVIVGAGISGISAAWHLQDRCPSKSYAVLERRDDLGGTWDLFKYPGIRSDSDMFTLGFRFKPWESSTSIADGASIKAYIKEAATENGIDKHIRYRQKVLAAEWSDADNRWTLTIDNDGQQQELTCSFLFACSGYYNYDEGYLPKFEGYDDFEGTTIHPQHWPEDLDYAGKKIVVIGSGATAITLIPSLVKSGAGHVTMLQRSPSYIGSLPLSDPFAEQANKWLPTKLAHAANRWKWIAFSTFQYQFSRKFPAQMRKTLLTMAKRRLPEGYDVEKHFGPSYNPWDQRLCLAPNGDLFKTIRKGQADVVTDTIDRFTKTGLKLGSGAELDADIIITATGLNLQLFGGAEIRRNGAPVELNDTMAFKGMMLTGYAEHGVHHRLHQRVVDVEGRPGVRVRLPGHQLHGREWLRHRSAAAPGQLGGRAPADGLHAGLCAARPGLPAQGRLGVAVAAQAELLHGPAVDPARQGRRRSPALRQKACCAGGLAWEARRWIRPQRR